MDFFLNIGLAWISVFLAVFLSIIYITGTAAKRQSRFKETLCRINRRMRRYHNAIKNVKVTKHNEVNRRFYDRPISIIPNEIVQAQSTDVDTVSGATFTSIGIINAVNDALSKAVVSGDLPADKSLPSNSGRRKH